MNHTRMIIRANGTVEPIEGPMTPEQVNDALDDAIPFTVDLRDGRVMMGDDNAHPKRLPINEQATKLYHSVCKPGTTHVIRGDVVVTLDSDFADGEF
jgi:hypothetical protein